jgi:hypothetical protein
MQKAAQRLLYCVEEIGILTTRTDTPALSRLLYNPGTFPLIERYIPHLHLLLKNAQAEKEISILFSIGAFKSVHQRRFRYWLARCPA